MPMDAVYTIVGLVLWALLVWPDAARAQRLAEAYARRRDGLIAVSLAGCVVRGVGVTILLLGGLKAVTAHTPTVPGPAMKLVAIGGVVLILGWMMRVVAWVLWKRRHPDGEDNHHRGGAKSR